MVRGQVAKRAWRHSIVFAVFSALLFLLPTYSYSWTPHPEEVTVPALRYQLLDKFGKVLYCDPDIYPVGITEAAEKARAIEVFSDIRKVPALFQAIVQHLHLRTVTDFSDEQKLLVYREYKRLQSAVLLEPLDGKYKFSLRVPGNTPGYENDLGFLIEGIINGRGSITISQKKSQYTGCPICLAGTTRIDTPRGPTTVSDLRIGTVVWTVDRTGKRRQAPIIRTSKTPVPSGHEMVDLLLDDGRELIASPGHPTLDGRVIGNLSVGGSLGGRRIVSTKRIHYTEGYTYDILPAGETGAYWADGILVASTLFDTQAKNSIK